MKYIFCVCAFLVATLTNINDIYTQTSENVAIEYTDEDYEILCRLVKAEADGECELGKRLVVDVVINRILDEGFPNTIKDVVFQENQFCQKFQDDENTYISDEIKRVVKEELEERFSKRVLYFKTEDYHKKYGTPLYKVGNHYFSKK